MTRHKPCLSTPRNQRPLVFASVILLALLIVPTTASTFDNKIPLERYKQGHRTWFQPYGSDELRDVFTNVEAQGDKLYANASETLISNPKKVAIIGECDYLPRVFML